MIKSECVGHVEKRMGSRFRNVQKTQKLGGKGKLTEVFIFKKKIKYYGSAIRNNSDSVENMQNAVMVTYYNLCLTDDIPRHENCPSGEESWCKYRVAEATGKEYTHPPPFHPDVQKYTLPIYQDLSRMDLLERCLGGLTQNANESLNALIWRFTPEHLNSGSKIVETAAYLAGCIFNDGHASIIKLMFGLQLVIGRESVAFAEECDALRFARQERNTLASTEEARTARKNKLLQQNEYFEESEGLLYGGGISD